MPLPRDDAGVVRNIKGREGRDIHSARRWEPEGWLKRGTKVASCHLLITDAAFNLFNVFKM
ncbi:hypothetical protein NEUTE2DRAFT_131043 [Neurospora tetrasperma FGSC 2509]|nr:hypothetical protein NEUTE2DRAFT_131043 [Neurospora tetrasperma FGSC 2509]